MKAKTGTAKSDKKATKAKQAKREKTLSKKEAKKKNVAKSEAMKPSEKALEKLRVDLLTAQSKLREAAERPFVVIICGMAAAGKGEVANLLGEWMDTRYIRTVGYDPRALVGKIPEAVLWQNLPAKGLGAIFFGGWYASAFYEGYSREVQERGMARANELERMLVDDGVIVVKLWLDLTKKQQKERLTTQSANKDSRWRVSKQDWNENRQYTAFKKRRDRVIALTSTTTAPWHIIPAGNIEERNRMAATAVLQALTEPSNHGVQPEKPVLPIPDTKAVKKASELATMDRNVRLSKEKYAEKAEVVLGSINRLLRSPKFARRCLVLALEGMDAAGKGGAIRRLVAAIDARILRIYPIAAPSEEERRYPYLWRFIRNMPEHGHIAIFDRTWYGRVLVERVEGFAKPHEWQRAYREINEFEKALTDSGAIVVKCWLAITPDEQLARFEERKAMPTKQYKITKEDMRNRKQWHNYELAASDMIEHTHTKYAPWNLISANDKDTSRLDIMKAIEKALKDSL
ncbi:MAG: hypothetical protein U0174_19705 [Polyangiaceae bacterium]